MANSSQASSQTVDAPAWRTPNRWLQISIRTALVLLTVGCVLLAVLVQRVRNQQLAVERIEQLGGRVRYDWQLRGASRVPNATPPGPAWLRRSLGEHYFQNVVGVDLDKSAVSDADMAVIGKLTRVDTLSLNGTGISDAGLAHIRTWRYQRYLGLSTTQVTSAGLRHLEGMPVDTLILEETKIDNAGLASIYRLPKLQILNLHGTGVTEIDAAKLPSLQFLSLRETRVHDGVVDELLKMNLQEWLDVTGTLISGEGLLRLRERLSPRPDLMFDCDMLEFNQALDDSDAANRKWEQLVDRMQLLHADGRLKLLDLSGSQITDDQLAGLDGLINVEMIDLRETQVTAEGVERFEQRHPRCKIAR